MAAAAAAGLAGLPPAAAAAPTPPPAAAQQGEQIQRQQQEQLDQDQTRILTNPRGQTVIEVPTHPQAVAPKGACQLITEIRFLHAPKMGDKDREKLTAPYLNRCLGLGDVENLLSDITRFYIDKSEPTTRVYIQPQNLTKGVLVLEVVEGKVEKIVLDNHGVHGVNLTTAFGRRADTVFNLRVFEQGLDQVNRLASNHATLDILPGSAPGESVIEIRNTAGAPLHVSASYDNAGQPSTGRNQGAVSLIGDDFFGLNDQISYTRRQTIPDGRPNADSRSNSVLVSVPYNALTLTVGASESDYTSQTVTSGGTVFVLSGYTRNIFGELDAAVWRNRRSKLDLSATITSKLNRNFVDGAYLSVSSRSLTVLDLWADYTTLVGHGSMKLGLGWSQGLSALGALQDAPGTPADSAHAQFGKLQARAYLSLPFKLAGQTLVFTSEAQGQYALKPLYSSEQIVVGSPYTVRGFLLGSVIDDRGFYAQNDLSLVHRARLFGQSVTLRPHIGLDAGYATGVASGLGGGFLSGGSFGLAAQAGRISIDAYTSHSISRAGLRDEGFVTFVRATLSL
ncbi:ShlB/FhaC/HecB family hemolysin secretion/activation protein [Caulobacter sp. KR2-114]|uniref:ShlB/FhaC/HecB family hemolysin secretion/activation protein n=1 Tax=Caulobacter sp. KR2-114 TaxID=3400912 RepID=UPI003BFC2F1D